jgi:hypothetical protein
METKTTHEIWSLLEDNLTRLENANRVETMVLRQTQAAVGMLLECDPAEVLVCMKDSAMPTRALVSWLAYEGGRLGMPDKAGALVKQWSRQNTKPQSIIPPPPAMG